MNDVAWNRKQDEAKPFIKDCGLNTIPSIILTQKKKRPLMIPRIQMILLLSSVGQSQSLTGEKAQKKPKKQNILN